MARRLNVRAIREAHGMSQSDLARHLWGSELKGNTLRLRNRTIRRWESGVTPNMIAQRHLHDLAAKQKTKTESDESGPRRKPMAGHLPSMDGD